MTELATSVATQLVPAGYAEKAMASLMQLHSELMDEKERRVELFRRLMEREQALAELKMYVKVLEEQTARFRPAAAAAVAEQQPAPSAAVTERRPEPPRPPVVPNVARRVAPEGWKSW